MEAPTKESLIGRTLDNGRYEIVKLIGEGGMGRVYQARQISMDRMVALKVLRAQLAMDEQLLARFQQEALSVSRLRHPNTITVYDYGRTRDGLLFISMELLGGKSLYQLLQQKKRLSLRRALHIMTQVVGAVAEAHKLGVVHRDLKPENIQIDQVGSDPYFAKVLDFGIAKIVHGDGGESEGKTLTMAGAIFGTPAYMSPEQVHGEKVDHRTDLYSLGVILYELLAGQQPFTGATPMAIMMAQASKAAPPLQETCPEADVNDAILAVLDRCLAKEREQRYASAEALQRALQSVQVDIGDLARSQMIMRDSQWASSTLEARPKASASLDAATDALASAATVTPLQFESRTPTPAGQVSTGPPPAALSEELPTLPPNRGPWLMVALIALLIGGGLTWWLTRGPTVEGDPPSVVAAAPSVPEGPSRILYHIYSNPSGARVLDGDLELGTTPLTKSWRRGMRKTLRFELADHDSTTLELLVEGERKEEHRTVRLEPLIKPPAPFKITSTPEGATVRVGDAVIGTTPLRWTPPTDKEPITFAFALEKHGEVEVVGTPQAVDLGPVEVQATLEPERPKRPARPRPAAPATRRPRPAAAVSKPPKTPSAPKSATPKSAASETIYRKL